MDAVDLDDQAVLRPVEVEVVAPPPVLPEDLSLWCRETAAPELADDVELAQGTGAVEEVVDDRVEERPPLSRRIRRASVPIWSGVARPCWTASVSR
ncbi:hypothetical protein [Nocardioides sp. J9]|uniref:hypothetical protein n=1 Tax=Nocardioides sp. J9 TaxID=935844 RepID=UPI0021BDB3B0|nr:hypothetical protein [Nocardioides sp. J9]